MTAIVFPTSPTVNQTFTAGSRTWIWTGTAWESVASSGPTGPTGPAGTFAGVNTVTPLNYNSGTNTLTFTGVATSGLSDASIANVTAGDVYTYNGTQWTNQKSSTVGLEASFLLMGA